MGQPDESKSLRRRAPSYDTRKSAGNPNFVPIEELGDFATGGGGNLGSSLTSGRGDEDHLRVVTLLVFHKHDADDDTRHELSAIDRSAEHQRVKWIAVERNRLRNISVVHGKTADRRRERAIEPERVGRHVEFPLPPLTARDLDVGVHGAIGVPRRRVAPDMPVM